MQADANERLNAAERPEARPGTLSLATDERQSTDALLWHGVRKTARPRFIRSHHRDTTRRRSAFFQQDFRRRPFRARCSKLVRDGLGN